MQKGIIAVSGMWLISKILEPEAEDIAAALQGNINKAGFRSLNEMMNGRRYESDEKYTD